MPEIFDLLNKSLGFTSSSGVARLKKLVSISRFLDIEKRMKYIFHKMGYETMWVSVPPEKVPSLPFPAFYIDTESPSRLKFVVQSSPDHYLLYDLNDLKKGKEIDLSYFTNENNNFFIYEKNEFRQPIKSTISYKSYYKPIAAILLAALIISLFVLTEFSNITFIGCVGFVGTYLFYSLIKNHFFHTENIISYICDSKNRNSCNKVLNYKLFDCQLFDFKLLGFIYFLSLTFIFIAFIFRIIPVTAEILQPIILLGIAGVVFSLYLQIFKLRAFCKICIASAFLIILNFLFLGLMPEGFQFHLKTIFYSIFFISLSCIFGLLVYNLLDTYSSKELAEAKIVYFKSDYKAFISHLSATTNITELGPHHFEFGGSNAEISIGLVISLKCIHCYKALAETLSIIENLEKYNLKIWFTSRGVPSSEEIYFLNYIIEKRKFYDTRSFYEELSRWYKLYKAPTILNKNVEDNFIKGIAFTPILLFDGLVVPPFFDSDDLKYILTL
jgi:uncharacterized membrane protein